MTEHYLVIKQVHVASVLASVSLFSLRGLLMLARSRLVNHAWLRFPSYLIDSVLLASAVLLTLILSQYPLTHAWLSAKVAALLAYIVFGSYALKRGRTYSHRALFLLLALATVAYMYSVARTHRAAGFLLWLG